MNVTIYLKSTGSKEGLTYTFAKEEYKRLRTDFEAFLKQGKPKGGTYNCQLQSEEIQPPVSNQLLVEFDSVALIDVQIERIKEMRVQIEEAKHINQQAREDNDSREQRDK